MVVEELIRDYTRKLHICFVHSLGEDKERFKYSWPHFSGYIDSFKDRGLDEKSLNEELDKMIDEILEADHE